MKLTLKRIDLNEKFTLGQLFIDGKYFCDTLEDPNRDHNRNGSLLDQGEGKIWGDTAIPYGTYKMNLSYSPKFKRVLPRLLNVAHFEGILIHRGNSAADTHGCILVGKNTVVGRVTNSTYWEKELIKVLTESKLNEFTIEIT